MALSAEQRSVIQRALRTARRENASPREVKALVTALGVESNYQHDRYAKVGSGDRDSVGALQQRPSQGWGPAGESLETDVRQFLRAAKKANTGRGSAGQLAQAVQRSAFPGRYDERGKEADSLIDKYGGASASTGPVSTGGSQGETTKTTQQTTGAGFDAGQASALAEMVRQQSRPQAPVSAPQAPSFSAAAPTPAGYQAPNAQPIQQSGSSLAEQLQAITATQGQSIPQVEVKTTTTKTRGASSGGGSSSKGGKAPGKVGGPLLELFYNGPGGVNVDNGKRVKRGFVSGHTDHVHVAAGPKTTRTLAKLAQDMGLTVRELEPYDKVDPVHTGGSYHYRKQAADISGDPKLMAEYSRRVARLFGVKA